MSLLWAEGLSLSYGSKVLFQEASFSIGPRDRIGLLGKNGTGKSTLLKILARTVAPDAGVLQSRRQLRVGYLPQELTVAPRGTLLQEVMSAVPGRDLLESKLRELERALVECTDGDEQLELSQQLSDVTDEWTNFDAHYGRHRAEEILLGLGFGKAELGQTLEGFSGGWRMRAALAGLLLQDPDLLLLDEPTNHLDLPTLTWFDAFLRRSAKAFVLISHDRAFLDRQINRVLSLEVEGVRSHTGNVASYRRAREEQKAQLENEARRQALKRAETEAFIERFKAKATKARQVQSRIKMLEKEELVETLQERETFSFSFPEVARSGREVAGFRQVRRSFGELVVYDGLEATLLRGQRVAVVGVNGAGKSTLLKLLAREMEPDAGEVFFGHNVSLGYFAQHHAESLHPQASVLEEVSRHAPHLTPGAVRQVLGSFLFSNEEVDKKIGVLSGGERARVALAKLLVTPCNLLLLDEPTNHLDLDASESLIEALKRYEGTLLFVSHNESFLNQLATHVWDVRDRKILPYPGNLAEYLEHLRREVGDTDASQGDLARGEASAAGGGRERRRHEARARQEKSQREGPLRKEIARIEAEIAAREKQQQECEEALATPGLYEDLPRARSLTEAFQAGKVELEGLYQRWEEAQRLLEQMGSASE